jgi:hypothetical protein
MLAAVGARSSTGSLILWHERYLCPIIGLKLKFDMIHGTYANADFKFCVLSYHKNM